MTTIIRVASVVAQTALEVGGEVTRQVIVNGHVNDWTGVAIAGGTAALGSVGDLAETTKQTNRAAAKALSIEGDVAEKASGIAAKAKNAFATFKKGIGDLAGGTVQSSKNVARNADTLVEDAVKATFKGTKAFSASVEGFQATAKTANRIEQVAEAAQRALIIGNAAWEYQDKDRAAEVGRKSAFHFGSAGPQAS